MLTLLIVVIYRTCRVSGYLVSPKDTGGQGEMRCRDRARPGYARLTRVRRLPHEPNIRPCMRPCLRLGQLSGITSGICRKNGRV